MTHHQTFVHIGGKRAKTCVQRVHVQTQLPILHATFGGWVG